jgi:hypothetical protein
MVIPWTLVRSVESFSILLQNQRPLPRVNALLYNKVLSKYPRG